jgi:hypothetical protein
VCCLRGPCRGTQLGQPSELYKGVRRKGSVGREPPFGEDLSAEAEESPPLIAVIGEGLMKIQEAGKRLADAMVICKVWR